jgi:hypothetical protein
MSTLAKYTVNIEYPICLVLDTISLIVLTNHLEEFRAPKWRHPLFVGHLVFKFLLFVSLINAILINETRAHASLFAAREVLVHFAMVTLVLCKGLISFLLVYRTYIIIAEQKLRRIVAVVAGILFTSVVVLLSVLSHIHLIYYNLRINNRFSESAPYESVLLSLNFAQIILFAFGMISSTGIIFYYIGGKILNRVGFLGYLSTSTSAKLAILFVASQLTDIIWNAIAFRTRDRTSRCYFHYSLLCLTIAGQVTPVILTL